MSNNISEDSLGPNETVEYEYWTDYQVDHHGIVFSWRNNRSQKILCVEQSRTDHHDDDFEIVLLDSHGSFLKSFMTCDSRKDALEAALKIQEQYPKGDIPYSESSADASEKFIPVNKHSSDDTTIDEYKYLTKKSKYEKLKSYIKNLLK